MKKINFFLKGEDIVVSLQASFFGLNYPLFDGNINPKARLLLASGESEAAFKEYERLAELGSGRARCVMAYAYLLGTCLTPRDLTTARKIALSAVSSEPGFAHFILACIELANGGVDSSLGHFDLSKKAGFLPAISAGAQLFSSRYCHAEQDLRLAENAYRRAIELRHIPAIAYLARFYVRGSRGFIKQVCGAILLPFGIAAFYIAWRFCIFSIHTFCYHPSNRNLLKENR